MNEAIFDQFWGIYPRKQDKKKARTAFKNLTKKNQQKALDDDLQERYKETPKQFIPLATTYIHGERWEDEIIKKSITERIKFPPHGNCDAWVSFAVNHNIPTKAGESLNTFENRVKKHIEDQL